MSEQLCNRRGSITLAALIAVVVTFIGGLFISKPKSTDPVPTPTITSTPILSPTPSLTPTPTSTPVPTPKPSLVATSTPKAVSGPPGTGVSTITVATDKGNFRATIMSLDNVRMFTDTASDSDCSDNCPTLPLQTYVSRNGGFAGVNGTYFCPASYSECSSKKDSFDFAVYNSRVHKWINSGTLGWGGRAILYYDGGGFHYNQDSRSHPGDPQGAIVNYPGLVSGGSVQIDDNQSGLSDKQKSVGTKVGIGTRGSNNVMVVIAYNVNMQQFAYVFKSLGATGALNLDSGGSVAMYYSGRYIAGPGRALPNAVVFAAK